MKITQLIFTSVLIIFLQVNISLHASQASDEDTGDQNTLVNNLSIVAERLSAAASKDRSYHPETMVRLVNSDFDSDACIAHENFNACHLTMEVCAIIRELAKANLSHHYLLTIAPMLVNLIPSTSLSYPKDPKSSSDSHQSTDPYEGELLQLLKRHREQYKQEMRDLSQNNKRRKK